METLKTVVIAAVVALIAVFGVSTLRSDDRVGSVPGVAMWPSSVTTFTQGGGVTSTSTAGAASTLLATDIDIENYVVMTPTGANHTLTLPATSTMTNIIPNAGDTRTIIVQNGATAATTTTIAAGAGMDLQEPDGQNVVIGQNNFAYLTLTRKSNGDMVVVVDETIPAD